MTIQEALKDNKRSVKAELNLVVMRRRKMWPRMNRIFRKRMQSDPRVVSICKDGFGGTRAIPTGYETKPMGVA
jgi:hypothetical protein